MFSMHIKGSTLQELVSNINNVSEALTKGLLYLKEDNAADISGIPYIPEQEQPELPFKEPVFNQTTGFNSLPPVPLNPSVEIVKDFTQEVVNQYQAPLLVPTSPVVASPLVDSRGVAWNEAVHSSSKAINKDGTWRGKRGVDPREIAKHEDIARNHATAISQPVPPVPTAQHQAAAFPTPAQTPQQVQQPTYQAPIQVPTNGKPAHNFQTFKSNFIPVIAELSKQGKVTPEYLNQMKAYFKVTELWEIMNFDDKMQECFETFVRGGLVTAV